MEKLLMHILFKNGVEKQHVLEFEENQELTQETKDQAIDGILKLFSEVDTLRLSTTNSRFHVDTNEVAHVEINLVTDEPRTKNGPRTKN